MNAQHRWTTPMLTVAMGLLVGLAGVFAATAQEIAASSLRVGSSRGMLGEWVLTIDVPDTEEPMHLLLNFLDIDGKLGATVQSSAQTQPQVITDITQSSLALKLRYAAQSGETESGMVLIVRQLDPGTLTGSMSDELGLVITGPEASSTEETLGLGLFRARVRGVRGGKIPGRALTIIAGKELKITYGGLLTGMDDFKRLGELSDGENFTFTRSRATKLFTGADLAFGNTVVKTENAAEGYPGVYSLWLKKSGDGWSLVFNEEADVWGSMHNAEADVAEVPLEYAQSESEERRFVIEILEEGNGGTIRLAWGPHVWSADFSLLQ